jgi:ketosteroid isomerase-like protein
MSENLDLVRSIFADWERGDFSRADWAHPDIEYVFVDGPEPGRYTGLAGMANAWGDVLQGWQDLHAAPERYIALDDARILVLVRNSGRGRTSGLEIPWRSVANLFEISDGQVSRMVIYWDRDRALSELGLAE